MSLRLGIAKTRLLLIPILALIGLLCLVNRVSAADEVVKAEMYMGDYEIRKNKVGSSFVYEEVKYIETGSAKVIKKRTSTTNTWVSSYYHTNHQGSTSVVSNNQGRVDTEYSKGRLRYFPYGEQITNHNINTQVVADTYTGQKRDTETNLMFYNARLYNQKTGLFMQADSVNDGLNRYMYVNANPISNSDLTGHQCVGEGCQVNIGATEIYNNTKKISIYDIRTQSKEYLELVKVLRSFNITLLTENVDLINYQGLLDGLNKLNPTVYSGSIIQLTESVGPSAYVTMGNKYLVNLFPESKINDLITKKDVNSKLVSDFNILIDEMFDDDDEISAQRIQEISLMHEYLHIYQAKNPETVLEMEELYLRNKESLEQRKIRDHINVKSRDGRMREAGAILTVEEVLRNQIHYRNNYEEIYNYVYDLRFFRQGVLKEPRR